MNNINDYGDETYIYRNSGPSHSTSFTTIDKSTNISFLLNLALFENHKNKRKKLFSHVIDEDNSKFSIEKIRSYLFITFVIFLSTDMVDF